VKFIFDHTSIEPQSKARCASLLAMDTLEKTILYSDYDVINYGLKPCETLEDMLKSPYIYACRSWGSFGNEGVKKMLEVLTDLKRNVGLADSVPPMVEYGQDDWELAPLVHFSRAACKGVPAHEVVETCGRRY
jgi:hypothetical protein